MINSFIVIKLLVHFVVIDDILYIFCRNGSKRNKFDQIVAQMSKNKNRGSSDDCYVSCGAEGLCWICDKQSLAVLLREHQLEATLSD